MQQSAAVVLYESKYGSTKTYARWLSQTLDCPMMKTGQATLDGLDGVDTLIVGGGLYATGIAGIPFLQKHVRSMPDKRIVVFAVGASPGNEEALEEIRRRNLKGDLSRLPLFYCRGAWNEEILTLKDRMMVGLLKKAVARKNPQEYQPWESALMDALGTVCDWTDPRELAPLLRYLEQSGSGVAGFRDPGAAIEERPD